MAITLNELGRSGIWTVAKLRALKKPVDVEVEVYDKKTKSISVETRTIDFDDHIKKLEWAVDTYIKNGPKSVIGTFFTKIVWTLQCDTACTDGIRLFFNPIFAYELLNKGGHLYKEECIKNGEKPKKADFRVYKLFLFVVTHEVYHQLYRHLEQAQHKSETANGKNHKLANVSMDIEINRDIEIQWPDFAGATEASDGCWETPEYPQQVWGQIFDDKYAKGEDPDVNSPILPPPVQDQPPGGGMDGPQEPQEKQPDRIAPDSYRDGWAKAIADIKAGRIKPGAWQPLDVNPDNFDHKILGVNANYTTLDMTVAAAQTFNQDEYNQGYNDCIRQWLNGLKNKNNQGGGQQDGSRFKNLEQPPMPGGGNGDDQNDGDDSQDGDDQSSGKGGSKGNNKKGDQKQGQGGGTDGDDSDDGSDDGDNNGQGEKSGKKGQKGDKKDGQGGGSGDDGDDDGDDNQNGQGSGKGNKKDQKYGPDGQGGGSGDDSNEDGDGDDNQNGQGSGKGNKKDQKYGPDGKSQPGGDDSDANREEPGGDPDSQDGSDGSGEGGDGNREMGEQIDISSDKPVKVQIGRNGWGRNDIISKEDGMKIAEDEGDPYHGQELTQEPKDIAKGRIARQTENVNNIGKNTAAPMSKKLADIASILKPPVSNWKAILSKHLRAAGDRRQTFKMDKRRIPVNRPDWAEEEMPITKVNNNAADVFYLVDASGSIGTKVLYRVFSEIISNGGIERKKGMMIRKSAFTYFADRVVDSLIRTWTINDSPAKKMKLIEMKPEDSKVGGGTDIQGAVDHVVKLKKYYSTNNPKTVLIVFTDAEDWGNEKIAALSATIRKEIIFCVMNSKNRIQERVEWLVEAGIPAKNIVAIDTSSL